MKFKVNKEVCIGCGVCVSLCEKCFRIAEDGLAEGTGVDCDANCDVENICGSCPANAIESE